MLFRRDALMKLREWRWPRRLGVSFPERSLDFNGERMLHTGCRCICRSREVIPGSKCRYLISPTVSTRPMYRIGRRQYGTQSFQSALRTWKLLFPGWRRDALSQLV